MLLILLARFRNRNCYKHIKIAYFINNTYIKKHSLLMNNKLSFRIHLNSNLEHRNFILDRQEVFIRFHYSS